jgi:hypothetical protein
VLHLLGIKASVIGPEATSNRCTTEPPLNKKDHAQPGRAGFIQLRCTRCSWAPRTAVYIECTGTITPSTIKNPVQNIYITMQFSSVLIVLTSSLLVSAAQHQCFGIIAGTSCTPGHDLTCCSSDFGYMTCNAEYRKWEYSTCSIEQLACVWEGPGNDVKCCNAFGTACTTVQ